MPPTPDATTLVQIDQTQILDWAWDRLSANPDAQIKVARTREFPQPDPGAAQIAGVWLEGVSAAQSAPMRGYESGTFLLHVTTFVSDSADHPWAPAYLSTWMLRRLFPVEQCASESGLSVTPVSYQSSHAETFGDGPMLRGQQHQITLQVVGSSGDGFNTALTA